MRLICFDYETFMFSVVDSEADKDGVNHMRKPTKSTETCYSGVVGDGGC